jgi:hypothetical protein
MRWTCALSLLFALACSPIGPSGGDDTGTNPGADGGGTDHRVTDAGRADSRHPDAGRRDIMGTDWMAIDIASFDIAGYDLGMREYDGGAEPGVVCGDTTCTGEPCCAGMATACGTGGTCTGFSIAVPCDGNEDCDAGICVASGSGLSYSVGCVAPGTVDAGRTVCINSSQCDAGGVCCSVAFLGNLGVDLGWCETAHCGN